MKTLRMLSTVALVLISGSAFAQSRPWKVPFAFRIGQQSGFVTVVVRAIDEKTDEVLVEDTVNVMVSDWRFSGLLSLGLSDASAAQTMKDVTSLRVEYARASAPDSVLGTLRYGAPAWAMTLSPNAVITNTALLAQPALNVMGGGTGLSVSSTTSNAAVSAEVTSTTSTTFVAAVEGVSNSPDGAGGHFINSGGGLQLRAERADGSGEFTVEADGTVRTRGQAIPEFGPKGPRGDTGPQGVPGNKGPTGNKGPRGDTAPVRSFGVVHTGNSCLGVCQGRTVLQAQAAAGDAGCTAVSQQGNVSNTMGGMCCVCGM